MELVNGCLKLNHKEPQALQLRQAINQPGLHLANVQQQSSRRIEEEFTTPFTIEDENKNSAKTREVATQTDLFESKEADIQTDASDVITLIKQYETKIEELKSEIERISKKNDCLQSKLFSINRFCAKDSAISFCTSLPNNNVLMEIYNYLDPGEQ